MSFPDCDGDSFVAKDQVADYFESWAKTFNAPIRTGVEVLHAQALDGRPCFRVETSKGVIETQRIIAATGPFQKPVIPAIAQQNSDLHQIHSAHYFRPQQLPAGGVLVIGAGSSGVQIADELQRAGKRSGYRLAHMIALLVVIVSVISVGGWGCWAFGKPPSNNPGRACHHRRERCPWRSYC